MAVTKQEKTRAAVSIALNGLLILAVVASVIYVLVLMADGMAGGGTISVGGIAVILLAVIAWNTRKKR